MPRSTLLAICCLAGLLATPATAFDHSGWDDLLRQYVVPVRDGHSTAVDYAGFAADRERLRMYLGSLSNVRRAQFDDWSSKRQLAFLINTYNAWTVELVLTGYPDIESIKDLGGLFRSPWEKTFIPLLGAERSLDEIEHGMIRGSGRYREPRIHFAVNCASVGCPPLRREAYTATDLESQLEQQTRRFLSDRRHNRLEDGTLKVSPLFKWYREDFTAGWSGVSSVAGFLIRYADALGLSRQQLERLRAGRIGIGYTRYDWSLNAPRQQ